MIARPTPSSWATILLAVLLPLVPAQAEFGLVENFDGLQPGPIDGQNGWTAFVDGSAVAPDPVDPDNLVLSVVTQSTILFREMLLLNDTTRMVFLRFRFADRLSCSFGLSDAGFPTRFDHFEVELSLTNAAPDLRINDDGMYEVISTLEADTWYNCWMLIDNESDETQVWLHSRPGDAATAGDQLDADGEWEFHFRNGTAADLRNFFIKTGGGSGVDGPLYLDDIYMETTNALNLTNPSDAAVAVGDVVIAEPMQPDVWFTNPFSRHAPIHFSVADRAEVLVTIHDATGRRVTTLTRGDHGPGRHATTWDGRTDAGATAGAGVYLVRVQVGNRTGVSKLVWTP